MKIECPRCRQTVLNVAFIKKLGDNVIVCDECEALWTNGVNPTRENFQDLIAFLKSKGINGGWNNLEIRELEVNDNNEIK